jgi:hypothetical protein
MPRAAERLPAPEVAPAFPGNRDALHAYQRDLQQIDEGRVLRR